MTSFQPSDDSFLMEKELIKKPVGEFLNELSNKVKRSSSVKKEYTLEEIQREYGFPPKGSSPLKTRGFLLESSSLSPPKLSNETLREFQKRTILQPVKILPSLAQQYDFMANSNSSETKQFVPMTTNLSQDSKIIIQKAQQEEVKDYSGNMNHDANREDQGLNQSTSKSEITSTSNKEIQNQTEILQNQSQAQNKADIPVLTKIQIPPNDDLNDSAEEQVVVLSHVRSNNHIKSILKPLANSPIRQKSLFTEFPDRQMPQRSFSLTSDAKVTLANSQQQPSQAANDTNRILKIQPIEQQNDSMTEKQTETSKPRENLRAAVQQEPELQHQKSKPILMRSQSLNGLKRVHFSPVQQESRVMFSNDRPLVDSTIFTVSAAVQEQKKLQQQQAQLAPQQQQLVHPPLANQNLRLSVPILGTQGGIPTQNTLTKKNEFVKFYSAFKQNLVSSRESSPSSVSPLPRRPNQNMASYTLSPVNTKRCKTSPSTSPVLLSLSPLKADKASFQTKDFSFRTVLNLKPAGAQLPQQDQMIGNEPAMNLDTQQNSITDLNISTSPNKVQNESPFLKQISQNSSYKQDMKLKYKYDNSNYITHGQQQQYYTPCYNIAPYQSHIKKNKDSNRLQSNNSELGEIGLNQSREQSGCNNSRNQLLIQVNKGRIITNKREQVDNSSQEEQKLEEFESDSKEREIQEQEQEIVEGEDKEEDDEDSEEITKDCCENDDIQSKQDDEKQTKLEKDEKVKTEESFKGEKEIQDSVNNEKKSSSPPPAPASSASSSQSPLLELLKDQVISKRARVYFKRQDTNPVDSEEVTAARAVADRVLRSNSMK